MCHAYIVQWSWSNVNRKGIRTRRIIQWIHRRQWTVCSSAPYPTTTFAFPFVAATTLSVHASLRGPTKFRIEPYRVVPFDLTRSLTYFSHVLFVFLSPPIFSSNFVYVCTTRREHVFSSRSIFNRVRRILFSFFPPKKEEEKEKEKDFSLEIVRISSPFHRQFLFNIASGLLFARRSFVENMNFPQRCRN